MFDIIRNYIRIQNLLRRIYAEEKIPENLSQTFGVECKVDWVGRLYMLLNPILQNMETGGNTLVFDKDNKVLVEEWVMKNLELIRNFVVNNSLFDMLTYTIERYDDDDNYLVVFKNIYFDDFMKICKWVSGIVLVGVLVLVGYLIF